MSFIKLGKCSIEQCSNHYALHDVQLRRVVIAGMFKSENDTDSSTTFPLELWVCTSCYRHGVAYHDGEEK